MTVGTESSSELVPNYLKASTPELLRESMFLNNLRLRQQVKYQDIQELKDGSWICWYYEKIELFDRINKKVK
jgi:hypothetical protein